MIIIRTNRMTIGETLFSNTLKMFSRHVVESEESDVAASDEVFPRYRNVITARDVAFRRDYEQ